MTIRKNSNSTEINTNDFDNVNAENINIVKTKTVKVAKQKKQLSAIAEKLQTVNSENSMKIAKAIKSIDFLFSSIRSIILSLIANNQSLNVFDKNDITATLRRSKKDVQLYAVLRDLSEFTYKTVKVKKDDVTTINIVKAFTVKSVLRSCEVFNALYANNDKYFLSNEITAIKHENELIAVEKVAKRIESLQNECNRLSNLIEKLTDSAKVEKDELTEILNKTETQLTETMQIFEYVRYQTNRNLIK